MTSDPDSMLLQQYVRTQDPVAFDQLARRYRAMVFSIARRVTQSHHDAEDVAQSCFLELARKAASIRSSIPAFLHATATRRSIDFLRDKKRRQKYETEAVIDRPDVSGGSVAERSWDEISPEVDQAIDRLPEELKTFVILYFLRGLSIADMVVETGINRGIIERRLQVGVRRLRADMVKGNKVVSAGVLAVGLRASSTHAVPAGLTAATGRMALASVLHSKSQQPLSRPVADLLRWRLILITGAVAVVSVLAVRSFKHLSPQPLPDDPYDRMSRLYANSLPSVEVAGEVAGFTLHTATMRNDTSAFWRGSQPLFFQWCSTHCPDWVSDNSTSIRCSASPNLEDAEQFSILVNTDSSSAIPVQIELLQGLIIARLATDRTVSSSTETTSAQVADALCQTYRSILRGDLPETSFAVAREGATADILTSGQYVDASGNLKAIVLGRQDKLLAFLRPSPIEPVDVQQMLGAAVSANAALGQFCGANPQIRAVRACVRHDSVVNQGQLLLIVQLAGSGILLELQQQTPAPAELAGMVCFDQRPAAQRAAEDASILSPTGSAPVGWCEWNQQSFTVVPLDLHPQVYELRKDRWLNPLDAARSWAAATAATHRNDPRCIQLADLMTPQLQAELVERSDAYLKSMQDDLQAFDADTRVARDRAAVDALSASWLNQPRQAN